jgi:integrase
LLSDSVDFLSVKHFGFQLITFRGSINHLNKCSQDWAMLGAMRVMQELGTSEIQKLWGHKSIKATMVYAHVRDDRLEHLMNKLPEREKTCKSGSLLISMN